jgi:ATP-dependent DNA helicase DinG
LFTARSRMEKAFETLGPQLRDQGLRPLCQDLSGPRWWLLDQLRQHDDTVLFGLKSFWEGVDVPGSALRCVILAKLPFAVPDDPIIEARQEHVRRLGGNPISDYYIPEAIVGFKQGVGRLIRARTDKGVVFVLDPRLWTRSYGRRFFRSIQRCAVSRNTLADCLAEAQVWLRGEPEQPSS